METETIEKWGERYNYNVERGDIGEWRRYDDGEFIAHFTWQQYSKTKNSKKILWVRWSVWNKLGRLIFEGSTYKGLIFAEEKMRRTLDKLVKEGSDSFGNSIFMEKRPSGM